ncbi:NAD(P)-dependent alcohol dehydrogenase [Panacagrimonas sp.]|uniref:NAD(P)-dependent alcohol dehydrogenase n=1 Tax=Panacagrimonas sp. TaxID=2480088 RepID=UPI003B515CB4
MDITAAVVREAGAAFSIETLQLDAPRADEVRVRIVGAGLCHTDLIARDQAIPVPLPAVFGHEGSGVVEALGEQVQDLQVGDHVVLSFSSCGDCLRCSQHLPCYCQHFVPLNFGGARPDGSAGLMQAGQRVSSHFFGQSSFATHALAGRRNVVKVDTRAPLELLGPLGCGFQTGAGGVMHALAAEAGSTIAIFGGGAVGLAAVMGAVVRGCREIVLVEPHAVRRALALELGATCVLDPAAGEVAAQIRARVPEGVDYAFDNTGIPAVVETALAALAPHGCCGVVAAATPDAAVSVNLTALVLAGHRIQGIVEGDSDPQTLIPELVSLFLAGRFPIDKLIATYPLAQINQAISAQHHGDCVKAVLLP